MLACLCCSTRQWRTSVGSSSSALRLRPQPCCSGETTREGVERVGERGGSIGQSGHSTPLNILSGYRALSFRDTGYFYFITVYFLGIVESISSL